MIQLHAHSQTTWCVVHSEGLSFPDILSVAAEMKMALFGRFGAAQLVAAIGHLPLHDSPAGKIDRAADCSTSTHRHHGHSPSGPC